MRTQKRAILREFFAVVTRHPVSFLGACLTTVSGALFLALFVISSLGFEKGPYVGILTFLIIPAVFVAGLLLIPLGRWLHLRRIARGAPAEIGLPVIDLNQTRTRRLVLAFGAATAVNMVLVGVAAYEGIEVMDSTPFCGQTCHSVMNPEFTTYQRSPHSRVHCVSCHIGPGADWFVKSKLSGSWQLISVALNLYPRPIPTPVHSLRPARDTCEQCHWPDKFVGDRLKVITHFQEDERNTPVKTVLDIRIGGRQGSASHGIHWHVDPGVRIRYRSDEKRETIYDVEMTHEGQVKRFVGPTAPPALEEPGGKASAWRTMDCVDCHNRPSHIYRLPVVEIDSALDDGRIDRSLPYIRREGLKALQADYASHGEARARIHEALAQFYAGAYPDIASSKTAPIDAAAEALGDLYCSNVFPSMNIRWGTYPNHIGHQEAPGCFRCHDGEHRTAEGAVIAQDCDTCHAVLAMEEPDPEILRTLRP